jgi:hypothetical protein
MVVTTRMYHLMSKSEPTMSDIDKTGLELNDRKPNKIETVSN